MILDTPQMPVRGTPFRRLTEEQCQRLHEAALEILERTGVRLHHQPAVDLLKNGGAHVSEGNRVRIPPKLIEQASQPYPNK